MVQLLQVRALFSPVHTKIINEMRIAVKDNIGRYVVLNNIDWFMTLILKSE